MDYHAKFASSQMSAGVPDAAKATVMSDADVVTEPLHTLRFVRAEVGPLERQHVGPVEAIAVVGTTFITGGQDGRILAFRRLPSGPLRFWPPELLPGGSVVDLAASHAVDKGKMVVVACCRDSSDSDKLFDSKSEGNQLVKGPDSSFIRLWNLDCESADTSQSHPILLPGHVDSVNSVSLQQTGGRATFAASASDDGTARIWDLNAGAEVVALDHRTKVSKSLFLPGETMLATTADRATRIWDLRSSTTRPVFLVQDALDVGPGDTCIAVGHRGMLVIADASGTLELFDAPRGGTRAVARWQMPKDAKPQGLQLVLKDRYISCASSDGNLYLVNMTDGAAVCFAVRDTPEAKDDDPRKKVPLTGLHAGGIRQQQGLREMLAYTYQDHSFGFGYVAQDVLKGCDDARLLSREPDVGNLE